MFTFIVSLLIVYSSLIFSARAAEAASADEVVKKAAALSGVQRKAFLEEGAKKEGEIVFYTSLSLTDYPKILPHFEKSYPFIKTNTYRSTPSGVFTKVDTEARAGRHAVGRGRLGLRGNVATQAAQAFHGLSFTRAEGDASGLARPGRLLAGIRGHAASYGVQYQASPERGRAAYLPGSAAPEVEGSNQPRHRRVHLVQHPAGIHGRQEGRGIHASAGQAGVADARIEQRDARAVDVGGRIGAHASPRAGGASPSTNPRARPSTFEFSIPTPASRISSRSCSARRIRTRRCCSWTGSCRRKVRPVSRM